MLTPEQLEKAARKYCEYKNFNPDEEILASPEESGCSMDVCMILKRWRVVANMLEEHYIRAESIRSAMHEFGINN